MALYILKFGGTSVASIERIKHISNIVHRYVTEGHQVVVVVSAMAGVTNQLFEYAQEVSHENTFEHDVILSSGEQITAGLTALCLENLNLKARSYLSFQIPILTDNHSTNASINHIDTTHIKKCLKKNVIPVVAGFQGVYFNPDTNEFRITTLGRGGSDTTAVALAAFLNADRCYIYTDVDGIYTSDPRFVQNAKKIPQLDYDSMLQLASHGARVLHDTCVEYAKRYTVDLCILSSFDDKVGSYIFDKAIISNDEPNVVGVAHAMHTSEIKFALHNTSTFEFLKQNIDKVCLESKYHVYHMKYNDALSSLLINSKDLQYFKDLLRSLTEIIVQDSLEIKQNIVTLSIIGNNLHEAHSLWEHVHAVFLSNSIPMLSFDVTQSKIIITVGYEYMPKALNILHDAIIP